ncbi:FAD/NAD(P)-binding protein [Burkholderia sola]|uniref:FAD/NAD(P)-binding protein n=1 Tax=Burkholderia sola TaxID=2843302 RepID=UPI00338E56DF
MSITTRTRVSGQSSPKDAVVIGGRACGTAVVVHLVDSLARGSRVTVIDPQDPEYPSVFGDDEPLLLTNTSHGINSLLPDRPDDFLDFLAPAEQASSVPRYIVGRYCRARLKKACDDAEARGIEVRHIPAHALSVTAVSDGYRICVGKGEIDATDVVIAIGVGEVRQPADMTGIPPFPVATTAPAGATQRVGHRPRAIGNRRGARAFISRLARHDVLTIGQLSGRPHAYTVLRIPAG